PNPFADWETSRQADKQTRPTTDDQRPTTNDEAETQHATLNAQNFRLYKTGDLARYRADGTLEYLGRIDHQVKLRGFRIELGEIEAVMSRHPAIRECVVTLRENRSGNKQLAAYFVPSGRRIPSATELRRFLQEKLPDYMVPSA